MAFKDQVLGIVFLSWLLASCSPTFTVSAKISPEREATPPSPVVSSVEIQESGLIVQGSDLDSVTSIKLKQGSVSSTLTIESKTATSLTAGLAENLSVVLGGVYEVMINNASAATFTFNIPGVVTACPTDMVLVPGATGYSAYCIEKNFREPYGVGTGGAALSEATAICLQADRHLCGGDEWRRACAAQPTGLIDMPVNYEWISDAYHADLGTAGNARGMIIGDTGCSDLLKNINPSDFTRFRCCSR